MPASTIITDYLAHGSLAARPVSLTLPAGGIGLYYADDTGDTYAWDGSAWQQVNTGGGGGTTNTYVQYLALLEEGPPGETGPPGPAGSSGGGGGGSSTFIGLSDVPAAFTSKALYGVRVNAAANALEFSRTIDPISAAYPVFTVGTDDDEFNDASFTGFTAVNSGSHNPTITESNDCVSLAFPGSDASAELHAYMKAATVSANDYIECVVRGAGRRQSYNIFGLIMADGNTYGAGVQVAWYFSPNEGGGAVDPRWAITKHANYSSLTTAATYQTQYFGDGEMFLRLKYEGANNWSGWVSPDGVSWVNVTGTTAYTMTPTHIGFFGTTWGGTLPFAWSCRYFKHSA